jgi:hypothetical protein
MEVNQMDFKVGDKVRFIDKFGKHKGSWFHPIDGWIGEVVDASTRNDMCIIKWGKNSGVSAGPNNDYSWNCEKKYLKLVEKGEEKNGKLIT